MPKAEHHIVRDVQCRPEAACRLRFVGVGAAGGRRPASGSSASRLCRSGKLPAPPALARSAVSSRLLAARVFGVRTVSCSPERAFLRCPGAVTPPAVPLVARSQPRPLSRLGGGSIASRRLACDPRSKDPLATRWPVRSRRHGAGGSPSSPTKARNLAAAWRGCLGPPDARQNGSGRSATPPWFELLCRYRRWWLQITSSFSTGWRRG